MKYANKNCVSSLFAKSTYISIYCDILLKLYYIFALSVEVSGQLIWMEIVVLIGGTFPGVVAERNN